VPGVERTGTRPCVPARLALVVVLLVSCRPVPEPVDSLTLDLRLDPAVPSVGREAVAVLVAREATGDPVRAATLDLEAHMTHPGMVPVVTRLDPSGDGRFRAAVTFTMAGEWVILVTGRLGDGRAVRQRVTTLTVAAD
jgi:hypothetical protein